MLTLANDFRWPDKLAFVAASILAVGLLIGAFSALRFRLSQRRKKSSAPIDFDDPLVYPKETPFSLLAFLIFNGLVVYLAFYVSWPLWLRLLVALPFIAMGAFCCFFASVFIGDWLRARRNSRSSPQNREQPPTI
jgi:MFS family permease